MIGRASTLAYVLSAALLAAGVAVRAGQAERTAEMSGPVDLALDFAVPPDHTRPWTLYHWLNGHLSKEGMTKDLAALADSGIGGLLLFDTTCRIPAGAVRFASNDWFDHLAHLSGEAGRHGMKFGMHNCAGWSSTGGPWITPEMSMKCLLWTETPARLGQEVRLREPGFADLPEEFRKSNHNSILNGGLLFYRDIAVLAFPTPEGDTPVPVDAIVNLTRRLAPDGTLDWSPPEGAWTVLRLGYTSTGRTNSQAGDGGRGLECDKLSREAADLHWQSFLDRVISRLPDGGLDFVEIDSFEKGDQNWTEGLDRIFLERCGYDPTPWLIAVTGREVGSAEETERFLWDFRATINDLMLRNYYGRFRENCHSRGLKFALEPYGNGPFDSASAALIPDLVMGEFWARTHRRGLVWHWACRIAASGARLRGERVVGAEALTEMQGDFSLSPRDFKPKADEFMAIGVNHFLFHTSAHQPWHDSVRPGMTMGPYGINTHRNNTWFGEAARSWHDYLARCSHILRNGDYVADVLVLDGDDQPTHNIAGREWEMNLPPTPGRQTDHSSIAAGILDTLSVDADGRLRVTREGKILPNAYEFLLVRAASLLRPEAARKLGELGAAGAKVFCERPARTPGLAGERELGPLLAEFWDSGVIRPPEEFSAALTATPVDCELPEGLHFSHTRAADGDYYFLANPGAPAPPRQIGQTDHRYTGAEPLEVAARFRIAGKKPEIWDPMTGELAPATDWRQLPDGRTEVRLDLEEGGSRFIVFREATTSEGESAPRLRWRTLDTVSGPWSVTFDPAMGPPKQVEFEKLVRWDEHSEDLIKHYSGTAAYRTEFETPQTGDLPTHLDLGEVDVLARVVLNGKDLGVVWKPPYRFKLGDAVRRGRNDLEIRVTNTWVNRLIGDARFPDPIERAGKAPRRFP